MNLILSSPPKSAIFYPSSDGKRMAENTLQAYWIFLLFGNLQALFRAAEVFIAADLLWYPVEGHPEITTAPDVMLAFGRPKGHRLSYKQWEEGNVPPTVAFEILSQSNDHREMIDKFLFYEEHGVEEYYEFDPSKKRLIVFLRRGDMLDRVRFVDSFVSPRLGIRFDLSGKEMVVSGPDGKVFQSFEDVKDQARRLAELSRKARHGQASPEELAELERLEDAQAAG